MIFDHYQNVKSKYQNISRPEVFCEKGVVRNFAKFTGKHLCQAFFLNKVAGLRPQLATLLKESLWHTYFPVNFAKFLRTPFLTEYLWATASVYSRVSSSACLSVCSHFF